MSKKKSLSGMEILARQGIIVPVDGKEESSKTAAPRTVTKSSGIASINTEEEKGGDAEHGDDEDAEVTGAGADDTGTGTGPPPKSSVPQDTPKSVQDFLDADDSKSDNYISAEAWADTVRMAKIYFAQPNRMQKTDDDVKKQLEVYRELYIKNRKVLTEKYNRNQTDLKSKKTVMQNIDAHTTALILMEVKHVVSLNMAGKEDTIDEAYMPAMYDEETGTYMLSDNYMARYIRVIRNDAKEKFIKDVLYELNQLAPRKIRTGFEGDSKKFIPFRNGILDYETKDFFPHSPDYIFTWYAHCDWNPNVQKPHIIMSNGKVWDVDDWILDLMSGVQEDAKLIYQVLGAIVRPFEDWQMTTWFYSISGSSGKGTLIEFMRNILGGACVSLNLSEIDGPDAEFNLQQLLESGAVAILADENAVGQRLEGSANYKALADGSWVRVNRKYKTAVSCKFRVVIVQCMNNIPTMSDTKPAFLRRLNFIEFKRFFSEDEKVKEIKNDYLTREDVKSYIMKRCLLDMDNYYRFDVTQNTKQTKDDLVSANSPVVRFVNAVLHGPDAPEYDKMPIPFLYQVFHYWYRYTNPGHEGLGEDGFRKSLILALKDDDTWELNARRTMKVSNSYYDKQVCAHPWLAIDRYQVEPLLNSRYRGSRDIEKRCIPDRNVFQKQYTGGVWRKKSKEQMEDSDYDE